MSPSFDSAAWVPEQNVYGLLPLLMCREVIREELTKPPPADRLKAIDSKHCETQIFKPPRKEAVQDSFDYEAYEDDDNCSYISEGEPIEPHDPVAWGRSARGAWWRLRGNLKEDLIVRSGVSLASAELHRWAPGEVFQQKGRPRVLTSGKGQGCIRMPIQPNGWVTADASRAGGPQYLIRTHAPQWRAIHESAEGGQDIIVRASLELHSEVVASLSCGDVVEQDGPLIILSSGISRMSIVVKSSSKHNGNSHKVSGWVTADATAAGGPAFFKLIPEAEPNNSKRNRHRQ